MKGDDLLVCYDISHPRRLAAMAKFCERFAVRLQFSVFFARNVSRARLFGILAEIDTIIDRDRDDVRIYRVLATEYLLGTAIDPAQATIIT